MSEFSTNHASTCQVVGQLLDQLRRHPKRVVFTDGEDPRVIAAAGGQSARRA